MVQVNVRISPEMHAKVTGAAKDGRTVTDVIRAALESYFKNGGSK